MDGSADHSHPVPRLRLIEFLSHIGQPDRQSELPWYAPAEYVIAHHTNRGIVRHNFGSRHDDVPAEDSCVELDGPIQIGHRNADVRECSREGHRVLGVGCWVLESKGCWHRLNQDRPAAWHPYHFSGTSVGV